MNRIFNQGTICAIMLLYYISDRLHVNKKSMYKNFLRSNVIPLFKRVLLYKIIFDHSITLSASNIAISVFFSFITYILLLTFFFNKKTDFNRLPQRRTWPFKLRSLIKRALHARCTLTTLSFQFKIARFENGCKNQVCKGSRMLSLVWIGSGYILLCTTDRRAKW